MPATTDAERNTIGLAPQMHELWYVYENDNHYHIARYYGGSATGARTFTREGAEAHAAMLNRNGESSEMGYPL